MKDRFLKEWPQRIRVIPELEKLERWQAYLRTTFGQFMLALWISSLLFVLSCPGWWLTGLAVFVNGTFLKPALLPLMISTLAWPFLGDLSGNEFIRQIAEPLSSRVAGSVSAITSAGLGLGIVAVFFLVSRTLGRNGELRRNLFKIHIVALLTMWITLNMAFHESIVAWLVFILWARYFWYFSYSLMSLERRTEQSWFADWSTFRPVWVDGPWSIGILPTGKASTQLYRYAKNKPEEFVVSQLKGLKLMIWAVVLLLIRNSMNWLSEELLYTAQSFDGILVLEHIKIYPPFYLNWWAMLSTFFIHDILDLAIVGHMLVAIARLFGFQMPRNMYRPIGSTNLIDFYNRYIHYFKELLNDFFFMPTFLFFRNQPLLRRTLLSTAVTMCFGNVFYHLMYAPVVRVAASRPFGATLRFIGPYFAIYFFTLACGLAVSQARRLNGRVEPRRGFSRLFAQVTTALFFMLLSLFNLHHMRSDVSANFSFFLGLWGL